MSDLPGSGAGKGFSHFPGSIPRAAHCRRLQARIRACLFVLSALPSSRASAAGAGLTLLHFLQVCPGLWWLEKLNRCQHPSWIL